MRVLSQLEFGGPARTERHAAPISQITKAIIVAMAITASGQVGHPADHPSNSITAE